MPRADTPSTGGRRQYRYRYCKLCNIADSVLTAAGWLLLAAAALYFGGHVVAALLS